MPKFKDTDKAPEKKPGKSKDIKSRGWACIVYPDSAPEDWISRLEDGHVQVLISPLHDQDVRGDGSPKKPHWHVLAMWDGPVTAAVAAQLFERMQVTAPPERVASLRGYARYLVHMDDHDKHRYDADDVIALSGASWMGVALDDAEQTNSALDQIEAWIDESGCVSYAALCRYARAERPDWTSVIRTHTIHLTALLRSLEWEASTAGMQPQGRTRDG